MRPSARPQLLPAASRAVWTVVPSITRSSRKSGSGGGRIKLRRAVDVDAAQAELHRAQRHVHGDGEAVLVVGRLEAHVAFADLEAQAAAFGRSHEGAAGAVDLLRVALERVGVEHQRLLVAGARR